MAIYQPEKQYTNHALMDEIVYNTELIIKDLVVKNDSLAYAYETQESADNSEIYIMCKEGTISFDVFPFTEEILIAYGITDPIKIRNYTDNKYNIPESIRDDLMEFCTQYTIDNYQELNVYYRALIGLPPIDQIPDEYIMVKKSWFPNDYFDTIEDFCTNPNHPNDNGQHIWYKDLIEKGKIQIYQLRDREIEILLSHNIIDQLIEDNKSKGIRFDYLRHLGAKRIDLIKARRANKWEILFITNYAEKLVTNRFIELYLTNREIFLMRTYQEAYGFDSDYYDEICIILLLAQTFNDLVVDTPEWYIRRDIFDIRSVQYFLEAYGVKFFKRIPLRFQIRIVKNLNKLIKYKSSDYNFRDILELFEVPDTKIYKYYLFKDKTDKEYPELKFIQTEMGDIYDNYIKDSNNTTTYDEITYADKYWDGEDTHDYIRNKIMEKDFTIERTKYYSIDYEINYSKYTFQTSYFLNLLYTMNLNTDDIRIVVSSIDPYIKFRLSDLFLLISCFNLSYHKIDTSVINPPEKEKTEKSDLYYIDYDGGYPVEYEGIREDILEECMPLIYEKQRLEKNQYRYTYNDVEVKTKDGEDFYYHADSGEVYKVYREEKTYDHEVSEEIQRHIDDIQSRIDDIIKYHDNEYDDNRMLDASPGRETKIDNYYRIPLELYSDNKYKTKDGIILWDGCYLDYKNKKAYDSIEDFIDKTSKSPWEAQLVIIKYDPEVQQDPYALLVHKKYTELEKISLEPITVDNNISVEWNEKFLTADGGYPTTYHNVNEEDFYHWMKRNYPDLYYYNYFDEGNDRIVAYNMHADLNTLKNMLKAAHSTFYYKKGWTLEELGINGVDEDGNEYHFVTNTEVRDFIKEDEDYTDQDLEEEKIPTLEQLIRIYHNNRKSYEALQHKMIYEASNMDEYRVFKFVFDYLFTIPRNKLEEYTTHTRIIQQGSRIISENYTYTDLVEMLKDRDYILYEYFMKTYVIENDEARQDAIQLALDQMIDTLQYYLKNNNIDYVLSNSQITSFFSIVTYIKYLLEFFKSYKIQFLDPYNTYIIDNDYSGDDQYHRARDVITELEIQDHYQDKHFIKDTPPYIEIERYEREQPYHNFIKEKMDVIAHFEPDPFDDYDYDGMFPNSTGQYKDADGGLEEDSPVQPYFMLDAGKPQLLMRNLWDLNGGTPYEMIDYLNIDGGRSLHPEDTNFPRNNFFIPTNVDGDDVTQYDLTPYNFDPRSTKFTYIIDGMSPSYNTFRSKTILTKVIDRQISQDIILSEGIYNLVPDIENPEIKHEVFYKPNDLKIDENGEIYITQKWVPWEEWQEWKPIVTETFELAEDTIERLSVLLGVISDPNALNNRIIRERDKLLYGLEDTTEKMQNNNFENSLKRYTDDKNNIMINTFNGFNPFEWFDY